MLVEPLDPDVPARRKSRRLTVPPTTTRLALADLASPAALGAAAAMALSSRGDALLLAALLGLGAGRVTSGVAAMLAAVAVGVRFGGTGLDTLASAQAVLGPAALIGSTAAAASSWCAAAAVVLGAGPGFPLRGPLGPRFPLRGPLGPRFPLRGPLGPRGLSTLASTAVAIPFGACAGVFAFGPGPGGDLWVRVVASAAATVAAAAVMRLDRRGRTTGALAVVAGAASLLLSVVAS